MLFPCECLCEDVCGHVCGENVVDNSLSFAYQVISVEVIFLLDVLDSCSEWQIMG